MAPAPQAGVLPAGHSSSQPDEQSLCAPATPLLPQHPLPCCCRVPGVCGDSWGQVRLWLTLWRWVPCCCLPARRRAAEQLLCTGRVVVPCPSPPAPAAPSSGRDGAATALWCSSPSDGVRRCCGVWELAGSWVPHVARAAALLASPPAPQGWALCPGLLQVPLLSCSPGQSGFKQRALVSVPVRSPGAVSGSCVPLRTPDAAVPLLPCPWEPALVQRPGAAPAPVTAPSTQ